MLVSLLALVAVAGCRRAPPESLAGDAGAAAPERKLGSSYPYAYPVGAAGGKLSGSYPNPGVALAVGDLPFGTAAQVLVTNAGATAAAWVTLSGKVTTTAAGVTSVSLALSDLPFGTAGQFLVTNAGGTAAAYVTLSSDLSCTAAGVCTVAKENGVTFKSGTPAIWSQMTYDSNATNWVGVGLVSATLTDASVTVDCGLSSAGTLNASQFVLPAATALTANRTITVNTDSAVTSEAITIVRLGLGAFTLAIVNGGTGGGTLVTLPASKARQASLSFDGTNWFLVSVSSVN